MASFCVLIYHTVQPQQTDMSVPSSHDAANQLLKRMFPIRKVGSKVQSRVVQSGGTAVPTQEQKIAWQGELDAISVRHRISFSGSSGAKSPLRHFFEHLESRPTDTRHMGVVRTMLRDKRTVIDNLESELALLQKNKASASDQNEVARKINNAKIEYDKLEKGSLGQALEDAQSGRGQYSV